MRLHVSLQVEELAEGLVTPEAASGHSCDLAHVRLLAVLLCECLITQLTLSRMRGRGRGLRLLFV